MSRIRRRLLLGLFLSVFTAAGLAYWAAETGHWPFADDVVSTSPRPGSWATPVDRPGLPNCFRVSDDLYRGAQPTAEGMRQLEAMGVRTIVNLREFHDDQSLLAGTNMEYETIRMSALHAEDEDVVRFLRIVTNPLSGRVFVHCQHGSDRTGTMCAAYRVVIQGWTQDEAIREMTQGGYGFHKEVFQNLVTYIRGMDANRIHAQMQSRPATP